MGTVLLIDSFNSKRNASIYNDDYINMLFNSLEFLLIFLPILMTFFWIVQRNNNAAVTVLLIASLAFYGYHSLSNLLILLSSICLNFFFSKYIYKNKIILWIAITNNLLLILYFKYANFIMLNLSAVFSFSVTLQEIALPLGISFFTFQQIAYLVDCYYGGNTEKDLRSYALLVSFFPHSIAGPLVQYKEIAPQFKSMNISIENITIGGSIFIVGLFKKIIIADGIAPSVNAVFDAVSNGAIPSFAESWYGALGYTFQLYFDFSGYSDMAIGLAKIFNVQFPINFDSPYKSTSIIDFWRRWHITLSNFLRNYLYIPLGGNRDGVFARYRNLLVTMMIGGLWHGANWTFVIWGLLHGTFLCINHLWRDVLKRRGFRAQTTNRIYKTSSWLITLFCIICAWVVFRSPDLKTVEILYKSMFGFHGISLSPMLLNVIPEFSFITHEGFFKNQLFDLWDYLPLMLSCIIICIFFPNVKNLFNHFLKFNQQEALHNTVDVDSNVIQACWRPSPAYALILAGMTTWIILALLSARKIEFLYFNF